LSTLCVGLALATLLNGLASMAAGMSNVFAYVERPEIFESADDYRMVMTIGTREAISVLAAAAALSMLQFLAWAIARRRAQL
jgi:hypothetical protein